MNPLVTEARALCEGASIGPWWPSDEMEGAIENTPGFVAYSTATEGDAVLIARSRTLLPEMAAEIERLEMQIEFLLKVIADKEAEINHPRTYSSGGYVYHETAINWPGFDSRTDKPSPR